MPPRPPSHATPRNLQVLGLAALTVGVVAAAALATAGSAAAATAPLGTPPSGSTASDPDAVNVGAQLTVASPMSAVGVRYYKGFGNNGTHTGTLWSAAGKALATATFKTSGTTGWQQATFATQVTLLPATTYTISYLAPRGHYSSVEGAFANGAKMSADGTVQTRGVFAYSAKSAFPSASWHDSNYFVSVMTKVTTTPPPTSTPTPPTSTPTPPTSTPTPPTTSPTPPPTGTWPASPPTAGTPAGQTLTPMSGTTITTPGTVIDGRSITGQLTVAASNVVIRNSRVTGTDVFGIYVRSGSATITNTTVTGGFENGVAGDNYVANGVEVTKLASDGFKIGDNVTITNSWCHGMTPGPGAHADCGQVQAGVSNTVVRHNWFDIGTAGNSALFLAPDLGPSTNGPLTIDDNVLGGGNFTLFCVDGNNGEYFIAHITIDGNYFLRGSQYGPVDVNVPVTASGNTWWDTGAALSI